MNLENAFIKEKAFFDLWIEKKKQFIYFPIYGIELDIWE
jgi:hypothetical protein